MEPILRSSLISSEFAHGFTTRHGGVSEGKYASFNLGGKWGDAPQALAENQRRLGEYAGLSWDGVTLAKQVHGASVVRARDVDAKTQADAIIAHGEPLVCAVLTADCVPVLIAETGGQGCAAIHSGWRGTVLNVVGAAVEALCAVGSNRANLVAAVGPCIELPSFEVGPEVAEQFPSDVVDRVRYDKPHVDLVAMVRRQLHQAGVSVVERVGDCTYANPDAYYSYRRDGSAGQMLSFIGAQPEREAL